MNGWIWAGVALVVLVLCHWLERWRLLQPSVPCALYTYRKEVGRTFFLFFFLTNVNFTYLGVKPDESGLRIQKGGIQ